MEETIASTQSLDKINETALGIIINSPDLTPSDDDAENLISLNAERIQAYDAALNETDDPIQTESLRWGYEVADSINLARHMARTNGTVKGASETAAITSILFKRITGDDANGFLFLEYFPDEISLTEALSSPEAVRDFCLELVLKFKTRAITEITTPELPATVRRELISIVDQLNNFSFDEPNSLANLRAIFAQWRQLVPTEFIKVEESDTNVMQYNIEGAKASSDVLLYNKNLKVQKQLPTYIPLGTSFIATPAEQIQDYDSLISNLWEQVKFNGKNWINEKTPITDIKNFYTIKILKRAIETQNLHKLANASQSMPPVDTWENVLLNKYIALKGQPGVSAADIQRAIFAELSNPEYIMNKKIQPKDWQDPNKTGIFKQSFTRFLGLLLNMPEIDENILSKINQFNNGNINRCKTTLHFINAVIDWQNIVAEIKG